MNAAEKLRREGYARGLTQGLQIALSELLLDRFKAVPAATRELIARASDSELITWVKRAARAGNLDDVFAIQAA